MDVDERLRVAAHARWAFVGLGLALMAAGAFLPNPAVITLVAGGTVLIIGGSFLYSYVLWRSAPDRQTQR